MGAFRYICLARAEGGRTVVRLCRLVGTGTSVVSAETDAPVMDAWIRYERRVAEMEARVGAPSRGRGFPSGPPDERARFASLWPVLAPHQRDIVGVAARMRASQLAAAEIGRRSGGLVLADSMGAGKTLSAIAVCLAVGAFPVLVLAPVSVVPQWVDEIESRLGRDGTVAAGLSASDPPSSAARSGRVFVVAPHFFIKDAAQAAATSSSVDWGAIVVDEAHVASDPRNVSHASCAALVRGRGPGGAPRFAVTITGTPCSGLERQNVSSMRSIAVASGWDDAASPPPPPSPATSTPSPPAGREAGGNKRSRSAVGVDARRDRAQRVRRTSVESLVSRSLACRGVPGVFPEVQTRVVVIPRVSSVERSLLEALARDPCDATPLVRMTRVQQASAGVHVVVSAAASVVTAASTAADAPSPTTPLASFLGRVFGTPAEAAVARAREARDSRRLASSTASRSPRQRGEGEGGASGRHVAPDIEARVMEVMLSTFGGVVGAEGGVAWPTAPAPPEELPAAPPGPSPRQRSPSPRRHTPVADVPFDAAAVVARVVDAADAVGPEEFFADPARHCTRLRALVECMRADAAEARSLGLPRPRTIVFAEYLDVVKGAVAAVDRLSAEIAPAPHRDAACRIYHGGMEMPEREEAIRAYMDGRAATLVLQLRAGGQGLNLGGTDHVYFVTQTYSHALAQQAPARATRMGARPASGLVRITHILIDGTTDAAAFERRLQKSRDVGRAMRGFVTPA